MVFCDRYMTHQFQIFPIHDCFELSGSLLCWLLLALALSISLWSIKFCSQTPTEPVSPPSRFSIVQSVQEGEGRRSCQNCSLVTISIIIITIIVLNIVGIGDTNMRVQSVSNCN